MTGGLPASPPADIVERAAKALHRSQCNCPDDVAIASYSLEAVTVLAAVWPDVVALVAARDTDETTLRTRIAEQIRANKRRWPSVSDVLEDAARIAEGAGS